MLPVDHFAISHPLPRVTPYESAVSLLNRPGGML